MKKQSLFYTLSFFSFALFLLGMAGCKKTELAVPNKQEAFFVDEPAAGVYRITAPGQVFKIPVGLTTTSTSPRTVTVNVSSPSGAQQGTHYTLTSNTVTIPANGAVDSIEVRANYAQYQSGRKDTLIFSIADADKSPNIRSTYRLAVSGPCFEGDVNLDDLLGEYKNTREDFGGAYGPYTTEVTAVNQTSPTTGTITVENIYDNGWNPITFKLDWTNPNNRTVTLDRQTGIGDAGTVNPAYDGEDIQVRNHSNGQIGTFSICNQTISIRMQVGVVGLGYFGTMYIVNMAR
jgi:hypothetical protein